MEEEFVFEAFELCQALHVQDRGWACLHGVVLGVYRCGSVDTQEHCGRCFDKQEPINAQRSIFRFGAFVPVEERGKLRPPVLDELGWPESGDGPQA